MKDLNTQSKKRRNKYTLNHSKRMFKKIPILDKETINDTTILLWESIFGGNKNPKYVVEVKQPMPFSGWVITFNGLFIMFFTAINY